MATKKKDQMNIAELGVTKKQLLDAVVTKIAEELMGDLERYDFEGEVGRKYLETAKAKVDEIGDRVVAPAVADAIEKATLQATNEWGEKKGKKLTFVEYLVAQAERYMTETVNYEGQSQTEVIARGRYASDFRGCQTRIVHLVGEYLHGSIASAMKQALNDFNKTVATGIEEAIKIQVQALMASMKVDIKTKG